MKYEESEARIPGEYIVVFKEDASDEDGELMDRYMYRWYI